MQVGEQQRCATADAFPDARRNLHLPHDLHAAEADAFCIADRGGRREGLVLGRSEIIDGHVTRRCRVEHYCELHLAIGEPQPLDVEQCVGAVGGPEAYVLDGDHAGREVLRDHIVGLHVREQRGVDGSIWFRRLDAPDDPDGTRIDCARKDIHTKGREEVVFDAVIRNRCRRVWCRQHGVQPAVTVDDVIAAATFDQVAPGAAEQDVAIIERNSSGDRPLQHVEAGDLVGAGVGEHVVDEVGGNTVVATQDVVVLPTRQALDEVHTISVGEHRWRQKHADGHVGVGGDRIASVDCPVEATHAFSALDAGADEHDVVAAFGVVVLLATPSEDDVIAGVNWVVLERSTGVALQQVERPAAAFDPVVALVTEHGVEVVAGEDEVVAGASEGFGGVVAADDEVFAVTTEVEVAAASARRNRVVAGSTLDHFHTEEVGDDVVADTAQEVVVAVAALDAVIAVVTAHGVVAESATNPIPQRGALEVDVFLAAVPDGAVEVAGQQCALVPLGGGVVNDRASQFLRSEIKDVGRRREGVCGQTLHIGISHDQLGERVALELCE